jgi:hypothetical protein
MTSNRYGSRKFLLALLVVLLATGLRVFDLIDGGMWVTVVSLALTLYLGANVAQKKVASDGNAG